MRFEVINLMLNLKQKTMKKLVLIGMMCLVSVVTFANFALLNKRSCTATYILKYFNSAGVNYRTTVNINTASTCAKAMEQAKAMALAEVRSISIDEPLVVEEGDADVINNALEPFVVPTP